MTLYAIRPDPGTGSIEDAEVVDQLREGWQFLEQAITVWRLVDKERADEIEAIKDRASLAAGDGEIRLHAHDLDKLVRLLTGVDNAVIAAGIVDRHWRVPADRLEELARQVPAMDLTTERSLKSKASALGEVMINAVSIRNFLSNALYAGCSWSSDSVGRSSFLADLHRPTCADRDPSKGLSSSTSSDLSSEQAADA